jgi:hypothetical protein
VLRSACFGLRSSFRGRFVGFVTLRPKSTQPLRPRRSAIRRSEFFVLPAACCVRRSFTPLHRINGRRRRPSLCHLELRFIRLPRDTRRCKQFPPEILDFRKKPPQTKLERRTQNAERRTQNAERRTQNAERRTLSYLLATTMSLSSMIVNMAFCNAVTDCCRSMRALSSTT